MRRHGQTSNGKQRWFCFRCKLSSIRKRPDVTLRHRRFYFTRWLLGNQSLTELSDNLNVSRQTLVNWFIPLWREPLPLAVKSQGLSSNKSILILDALYLGGRENVVLIGRTTEKVNSWRFAPKESLESWFSFFESIDRPWVVVIDGQKGMMAAIKFCWPEVKIQRCLAHIIRRSQTKLTKKPKIWAAVKLRKLIGDLSSIRTRRQKRRWLRQFHYWERKYCGFLIEKTFWTDQRGKRRWHYTHRNIRSIRSLIRNSLPHLFTFIRYPQIPKTTNHVEGGINSRLKELLHRHRGLSFNRKRVLTAYFLLSKQR